MARDATEATGRELLAGAIGTGAKLPGQAAGEYATSLQSGNQAANTKLAQTQTAANTTGTGVDWANTGTNAINAAGNLMGQDYSNKNAKYAADQESSSGLGSLAGFAAEAGMNYLMPGSGAVAGMAFAEGGAIPPPGATPGGNIPDSASPSQGAATDDVNAKLTAGEFVIPKDVMSWFGEKYFQDVIQKARAAQQQAPAKPRYGIDNQPGPPSFVSRSSGAIPAR